MTLSRVKKNLKTAPHLWVIFRTGRGYAVSIGDPRSPWSKLLRRFPNQDEITYWAKEVMSEAVSPNHVLDTTSLNLAPKYYTQWYVDNILGK